MFHGVKNQWARVDHSIRRVNDSTIFDSWSLVSKEFRVFSLQKRWIDSLLLFRLCELAVKLLKRSFEIQEILHSLFQNFCDWD